MRVNPGTLNKRIDIVQVVRKQDDDGYWTEPTDELIHHCWAQFSRTSGKEARQSDADYSETNVRFLIRWTSKELSRKMIVRYAGARYEIQYLNDYGDRHEYIEIVAKLLTLEG